MSSATTVPDYTKLSTWKSMELHEVYTMLASEDSVFDQGAFSAITMIWKHIVKATEWHEFSHKCYKLNLRCAALNNAFFGLCDMNIQLLINRVKKEDQSLKTITTTSSTNNTNSSSSTTTTTTTTTTSSSTQSVSTDSTQAEVKLKSSTEIDRKDLLSQLQEIRKKFKATETHFEHDNLRIPASIFRQAFNAFEEALKLSSTATLEKGVSNLSFNEFTNPNDNIVYLHLQEGKLHLFFQEKELGGGLATFASSGIHFTGNEINKGKVLRILKRYVKNDAILFPQQEHFHHAIETVDILFKQVPKTPFFIKPLVRFSHKGVCYAVIEDNCGKEITSSSDLRKNVAKIQRLGLALLELFTCGIYHLDLKPSNILETAEGSLKIIDFGLANKEESSKHVCGSPDTMHLSYFEAIEIAGIVNNKSMEIFQAVATTLLVLSKYDPFTRGDRDGYIMDSQDSLRAIVLKVTDRYKDLINKSFIDSLIVGIDMTQNSKMDLKSFYESLRDCIKVI